MDNLPDIGKCTFEIGGHESFIGSANISQDRIEHSLAYDTPIDCVWTIRTDEDLGIYIQFTEYKLQTPNDCNSNFIQVNNSFSFRATLYFSYCFTLISEKCKKMI